MDVRKDREQKFHDSVYSKQTRASVSKFYSITKSSRKYYRELLLKNVQNCAVLEYGCGPGGESYTFFLAENGARVTGIDISEVAIDKAQKRAREARLNQIHFYVMDAEDLEFKNDTFDLVCGTGILHHLDLTKAYSEITRVLKPQGSAVFLEPLGHNPLINIFRKLTPSLRSSDEHPLLMKDLHPIHEYFEQLNIRFFHLSSLAGVPFRNLPGFPYLLGILNGIDSALFSFLPPVRRYAWTVVMDMSYPKK